MGVNSTRSVGLTLVIVSGLSLITAGYSQEQISPMMGLLGPLPDIYQVKQRQKNE